VKRKYEINECAICEGLITHYDKHGNLMTPHAHSIRVCCNSPSCISQRHRINATRHFRDIPIKSCRGCPKDIPLCWPSGKKKRPDDYNKQQFHSNACRGKWRIAHPEDEPKERIHRERVRCPRPCWALTPPVMNQPIDQFIYKGAV